MTTNWKAITRRDREKNAHEVYGQEILSWWNSSK